MANNKQVGSSFPSTSSSFTADLFGAKESPSSSAGVFASIFPPPSTASRRNFPSSEIIGPRPKHLSESQLWSTKQDNVVKDSEGLIEERRSVFQERAEPSPLSSSLYYGGQEDMYVKTSNAQTSGSYPLFKKDGKEDNLSGNNSPSASRGNWWQGSLYY